MIVHVDVALKQGGFNLQASFDVPPGITVLFGPSGAGKSTCLAMVAGLVRPCRGRIACDQTVWFDSQTGEYMPPNQRRVGIVFQSLALFPHLSALQNVRYGIDRHLRHAERNMRAIEMLARMKVSHLATRKPATFSGGEAQRVALARALAMAPQALLLDEPFSALDTSLRQELRADIKQIASDLALPTILVTHSRDDATALADQVVHLIAGQVHATGNPNDVMHASLLYTEDR